MATSRRPVPELWILTALSAVLHFIHLATPHTVAFDEFYYERFAGYDLTGAFFADVHPPLGRLLFALTAKLAGVDPAVLMRPDPAPALRILPAIAGTLLVPLIFILLRQLGASRRVATLGGIAMLCENALLAQSRVAMPDVLLITFGIGALCVFVAARRAIGTRRTLLLGAAGLLAGCALSVKWTGASALGVILVAWLVDVLVKRATLARVAREGALLVLAPTFVYLASWRIEFALITHAGPGKVPFSALYQRQLPGSLVYDPAARKFSFWAKLGQVHHFIRYGNGSLERVTHPAASPWYTWPIMKHPIGLWTSGPAADGSVQWVILVGNPIVWWGVLIAALIGLIAVVRRRTSMRAEQRYALVFLWGGVLLNFVPFMAIQRVMYLYHYLFALALLIPLAAFSVGIAADWLDDDGPPWTFANRRTGLSYGVLVAVIIAGFIYFAPMTYGTRISAASYDRHFALLHPF